MDSSKLKELGLTDEQITGITELHEQTVKKLLEEKLKSKEKDNPELEKPQNKELAEAQKKIDELERLMKQRDIKAYAAAKNLIGEKADIILNAFNGDVELSNAAIDAISQIISETDTAARADEKKRLLTDTSNPGGNVGETETPDIANAKKITIGVVDKASIDARELYK